MSLYRQGDINFIVNREPASQAAYFSAEHGPSACGLAFRVKDAHRAYRRALDLGAQPVEIPTGPMELRLPAIRGIGGAPLYLIDRFEDGRSIYDIDFEWIEGVDRQACGGTHVGRTGEIKGIKLVKAENKGKANRRVYFELTE